MLNIYRLLDKAQIHNFIQRLLVIGRKGTLDFTIDYLRSCAKGKVLDIGCGAGRYAGNFDCEYVGIDINRSYINYAKKNYGTTSKSFIIMDANRLGFKDNSFDCVFSVGLLHHLNDSSVSFVIKEMTRVCKISGKLIIVDPIYPNNESNLIKNAVCKLERGRFIRRLNRQKDIMNNVLSKNYEYIVKRDFLYELIFLKYEK